MSISTVFTLIVIGLMAGVFGGMFGVGGAVIMVLYKSKWVNLQKQIKIFNADSKGSVCKSLDG